MFSVVRRKKRQVKDKMVYMEVYGDNKVAYRVTVGRIEQYGEEVITYGVEVEDHITGEIESIADFSRDIEDAVDFAEILISAKSRPSQIYNRALNYLWISI